MGQAVDVTRADPATYAPVDAGTPEDEDLRLWSVTTLIGALDKPALIYWAAKEVAKAAVHDQDAWKALADRDPEDAIQWLKKAPYRKGPGERSATQLGEVVHSACEEYALTGVRPEVDEEVAPFLHQFEEWCQRAQPEYQAAELTVYHPRYGYAGTADAFLTVGGFRAIVDYKTSRDSTDSRGKPKTPYPETALQLAAYRHAEFAAAFRARRWEKFRRRYYLLSPQERELAVPVPQVDGGLCLLITPDWCEAFPIRCDEQVFTSFLYVVEAARWQFQLAKQAIAADPLDLPATDGKEKP